MEKVKEKSSFFRKFVGDKRFYLMVLSIAVPIMEIGRASCRERV